MSKSEREQAGEHQRSEDRRTEPGRHRRSLTAYPQPQDRLADRPAKEPLQDHEVGEEDHPGRRLAEPENFVVLSHHQLHRTKQKQTDDDFVDQVSPDPDTHAAERQLLGDQRHQGRLHFGEAGIASRFVPLETPLHDQGEVGGHVAVEVPNGGRVLRDDFGEHGRGILMLKRGPAGQQVKECRPERINIGGEVHRFAPDLFRRGVENGAEERAALRELGVGTE